MSLLDTLYKIPMTTHDVMLKDSNVASIQCYSSLSISQSGKEVAKEETGRRWPRVEIHQIRHF